MNEAYTYGGNGSLIRTEYNKPREDDLEAYSEMVSDELESFFMCAKPSPLVDYSYSRDVNTTYRTLDFAYETRSSEQELESTFMSNTVTGELSEYEPRILSTLNTVSIHHSLHSIGTLREEYVVRVDREHDGTVGILFNRYYFNRYSDDKWQAWVEHNYVDTEPQEKNCEFYSRAMVPYDFDEFFKDTAQINTQLRMLLVQ